jgi:GNAT superfamily N-acetyltransferase
MLPTNHVLRAATLSDLGALEALIALSARTLGTHDYSPAQIEGALRGAFGVDTQLIRDGTYFVVQHGDQLVGCGGWSRRRTLFGGDARPDRDAGELDPRLDAAKIRAFFVHPDFARCGIGKSILEWCEQEATAQGFTRFELMATLPGIRFYAAHGYVGGEPIQWPLGAGLTIDFLPMAKRMPDRD